MIAFDPALLAEIAFRREDVRASFRSTRRLGARTATSRRGTTGVGVTRAARSAPVAGATSQRTA